MRARKRLAAPTRDSEVRVRVEASSVNSTNVLVRKGLYSLLKDSPSLVLGYDFVGRVVTTWRVGQRVAGPKWAAHTDYLGRPAPAGLHTRFHEAVLPVQLIRPEPGPAVPGNGNKPDAWSVRSTARQQPALFQRLPDESRHFV
ncbi:MAG: alcohol dehydrogenase catalytic domain-containing protein [Janthinobacterium lividum]